MKRRLMDGSPKPIYKRNMRGRYYSFYCTMEGNFLMYAIILRETFPWQPSISDAQETEKGRSIERAFFCTYIKVPTLLPTTYPILYPVSGPESLENGTRSQSTVLNCMEPASGGSLPSKGRLGSEANFRSVPEEIRSALGKRLETTDNWPTTD